MYIRMAKLNTKMEKTGQLTKRVMLTAISSLSNRSAIGVVIVTAAPILCNLRPFIRQP